MTKILYVEDEVFLAKIVKESLEQRDFEVRLLTDGAEAMTTLQHFAPDICILDVMLPSIDGFTLAKHIKQQYAHLPIIFLTAKDQTQDVLQGFAVGANDYLKKPFSMEELIVRIKNILQITTQYTEKQSIIQKLKIGSYTFHPLKYELKIENQSRKLSHRESELLKMLYEHRNSSLDRKYILMSLWGDDSYFNSRNLDVYIRKLREYLSQDEAVEIITLKGVGYHFNLPQ